MTIPGIKLDRSITFIVPGTVDADREADNKATVDATGLLFSRLFGGFTQAPGIGGWNSAEKGLIRENVTQVKAFTNEEGLEGGIVEVLAHVLKVKADLGQESVALEVNGALYLI